MGKDIDNVIEEVNIERLEQQGHHHAEISLIMHNRPPQWGKETACKEKRWKQKSSGYPIYKLPSWNNKL